MRKRAEYAGEIIPPSQPWRLSVSANGMGPEEIIPPESSAEAAHSWHVRSRSSRALFDAEVATHHRQLWDYSPIGWVVVDAVGAILSSNERAREMLLPTRSRSTSVALSTCVCNEDVAQLNQYLTAVFKGEEVSSIDVQLGPPNDEVGPRYARLTAISVATSSAALTLSDITELTRLQLELQHLTSD